MIKSPAMCDADVWIKMVKVLKHDLLFYTFETINMVGVVIREVRNFDDTPLPGTILNAELKKQTIKMCRQKDFTPAEIKYFKYLISEYRRKHHLKNRKSLGEIVSAIIAQKMNIPFLVSDDSFSELLKTDFELRLYNHYDVLNHCERFNILTKQEADALYAQIEALGTPKKQTRALLNKLKKHNRG